MANTNAPFGFRQYSGTGSAPTYEQVAVQIVYNASNIFYGDPVEPDGATGSVVRGDGTTGAAGIAGIFYGCQYLSVSQKRTVWSNYWPGSDVAAGNYVTGYIVNDPNAKFLVQSNITGITQNEINSNIGYDIGTGNTANGISGAFVTESSISTTSTLPFRIISLVTQPPGSSGTETVAGGYASGAYNWVIVAFNNVSTKSLTAV
jgi:hypothetical protein